MSLTKKAVEKIEPNCPSWCASGCGPLVHPEDSHFGEAEAVLLSLKRPRMVEESLIGEQVWRPRTLEAVLSQGHQARLPIVRLELDACDEDQVVKLTLDEALELAQALRRLVETAWTIPAEAVSEVPA